MPLASGKQLGPYEIVSPLGAGGMGEVYRALDTRLDRTVAIKVLPSHLSSSPESKQRFDREANSRSPLTPSTPTMSFASLTAVASPLTQKGSIVGTFQYLAPEALQGVEADARSDLFSFGCVLYEMITGRRAFEGKSQLSVLSA